VLEKNRFLDSLHSRELLGRSWISNDWLARARCAVFCWAKSCRVLAKPRKVPVTQSLLSNVIAFCARRLIEAPPVRDADETALLPLVPDPVSGRVDHALAGDNGAVFHVSETSLNVLDDGALLCVLRQLRPHHRAIARLACRGLNALVGPVASQRLPLWPLLQQQPLPWGCVWEAFLMLDTTHNQQKIIAAAVAASSELEHLQLLRQHCCTWNTETCSDAAGGGHLEVLQWAWANGCDWDGKPCARAARGGNLEVLQWARCDFW
jgi:hypothetical protein